MRSFVTKRGSAVTITLLLALASLALAISNRWDNPWIAFSLYAFSVICALSAVACYLWIPSGDGPGVRIEDSPNADIRGVVSKSVADKGIDVKRSPGAKAHLTVVPDEEDTDEEDEPSDT